MLVLFFLLTNSETEHCEVVVGLGTTAMLGYTGRQGFDDLLG